MIYHTEVLLADGITVQEKQRYQPLSQPSQSRSALHTSAHAPLSCLPPPRPPAQCNSTAAAQPAAAIRTQSAHGKGPGT